MIVIFVTPLSRCSLCFFAAAFLVEGLCVFDLRQPSLSLWFFLWRGMQGGKDDEGDDDDIFGSSKPASKPAGKPASKPEDKAEDKPSARAPARTDDDLFGGDDDDIFNDLPSASSAAGKAKTEGASFHCDEDGGRRGRAGGEKTRV